MKNPGSQDNPWRAVALVSAIGADLVVCMSAGYWLGNAMNHWMGGQPIWIVLGVMVGFIVGVISVIVILRSYTGGSNG